MADILLPGEHRRARWMRMDSAGVLKRLFFYERSLIVSQGSWLASIPQLEVKIALARVLWEDAMTANALRDRVFELRYPSRLIEGGDDAPLVQLFDASINAPGPEAFVLGLARVLKPSLLKIYQEYLVQADSVADGPSLRLIKIAVDEKVNQIEALIQFTQEMLAETPEQRSVTEAWVTGLELQLNALGGASLEPGLPHSTLESSIYSAKPFTVAQIPARDDRFHKCRFYWPDVVDPDFPYGEGLSLQVRSAISHLNEVWALERAGANLHAFADILGWEFIFDGARWTYDESRHCQMGYERLLDWGFEPAEIPLGSYIYESASGQDPIYGIGMLYFFETKNIGKKNERMKVFSEYGDAVSQHDMDYDWADETIHAHYGKHWLEKLFEDDGYDGETVKLEQISDRCGELVAAVVASATPDELKDIRAVAGAMLVKAESIAGKIE